MKKETRVAVHEKGASTHQPAESLAMITPQDLQQQITIEQEKRKIITEYITHNLKEGTDFGKIHVYKQCPNHRTPWLCGNKYHFSKNTLFKPGAEKFGSLFKMRAGFKRDQDTWEMLGSMPGTVCYICNLYTQSDVLVGEGRGACTVEEKSGSGNTAVKIAKKRAFVDAVLSTGALSDFFTQDLEDMKDKEAGIEPEDMRYEKVDPNAHTTPQKPQNAPPRQATGGVKLHSPGQRKMIFALLKDLTERTGTMHDKDWLEKWLKKPVEEIDIGTMSAAINGLLKKLADMGDEKAANSLADSQRYQQGYRQNKVHYPTAEEEGIDTSKENNFDVANEAETQG